MYKRENEINFATTCSVEYTQNKDIMKKNIPILYGDKVVIFQVEEHQVSIKVRTN